MAHMFALTACATPDGPAGRWIGSVEPTSQGATCNRTQGLLEIKRGIVTFTPNEGTWILQGLVDADGSLHADHAQIGVDKKPYETTLQARWTPQAILGTYTTPRCSFTISLYRA